MTTANMMITQKNFIIKGGKTMKRTCKACKESKHTTSNDMPYYCEDCLKTAGTVVLNQMNYVEEKFRYFPVTYRLFSRVYLICLRKR